MNHNRLVGIKVVAFDADDTLWVNEPYFRAAEDQFCKIMEEYLPLHSVSRELLKTEIDNIEYYGYGIKSFVLSMIESAIQMSNGTIGSTALLKMINIGKEMLSHPIELLEGVEEVLMALHGKYRMVMATKGDLLDQQKKLRKSGLEKYFHHIEIVSEKNDFEYSRLIKHLDIEPKQFVMIGNSLKSDILPILNIGGHGFHIPYHTTWEYEKVDKHIEHDLFKSFENIIQVLDYI